MKQFYSVDFYSLYVDDTGDDVCTNALTGIPAIDIMLPPDADGADESADDDDRIGYHSGVIVGMLVGKSCGGTMNRAAVCCARQSLSILYFRSSEVLVPRDFF